MYKMEKKHKIIVGIVVVIVAFTTIGLIVFPQSLTTPAVITPQPIAAPRNDQADPNVTGTSGSSTTGISDLIVVSSPESGDSVTSPLKITGKARGSFFFEASFPIELVNENTGVDFGKGTAQAQGDWQTDDFVPFTATLTYEKPGAPTPGILLLKKDNPSGLPENDASISVPVVVK